MIQGFGDWNKYENFKMYADIAVNMLYKHENEIHNTLLISQSLQCIN